jgi:hypothetical protein
MRGENRDRDKGQQVSVRDLKQYSLFQGASLCVAALLSTVHAGC